jgi:hypothetical protein
MELWPDRFLMLMALQLEGVDAKDLLTAGTAVRAFVGEESPLREGAIEDCWFLYADRAVMEWTLVYPRGDITYLADFESDYGAMPQSDDPSLLQTLMALSCLDEAEATGTFGPAGALGEARASHTATLLPDGRVLVVGGSDGQGGIRASAEVWDPVTETFGPAGALGEALASNTATLLPDGRVLVVGGFRVSDQWRPRHASAEVWDPVTKAFGPAGSLGEARLMHTATLLPDGRVLVVGGVDDDSTMFTSAKVWEPTQ